MKTLPVLIFGSVVALLLVFRFGTVGLTSGGGMPALVSLAVGGAALWVILSQKYGPNDKHWAYATVGTLLGYWLKG